MKTLLHNALKTVAATGFVMAIAPAQAGLIFQVQEGSVSGAVPNLITSDRIAGSWEQTLNFLGGSALNSGGYISFSDFKLGAVTPPNQLSPSVPQSIFEGANNYGMYAIFNWAGSLSGTTINGATGSLSLWIDPSQNTTKTAPVAGSQTVTLGGTGEDYQIGAASLLAAGVDPPPGTASWNLTYEPFTLVGSGASYFVAPIDFYVRLNLTSEINEPFCSPAPCSTTTSGEASAQFAVPEPGALALLGISLVGLGLARRRPKVV